MLKLLTTRKTMKLKIFQVSKWIHGFKVDSNLGFKTDSVDSPQFRMWDSKWIQSGFRDSPQFIIWDSKWI